VNIPHPNLLSHWERGSRLSDGGEGKIFIINGVSQAYDSEKKRNDKLPFAIPISNF